MKRSTLSWLLGALCLTFVGPVHAVPTLRTQVDQLGDFALIGNTLAHDCAMTTPAPVVGTVGACGSDLADSAPDIFWRADAPQVGQAVADNTLTAADARSSAMLELPTGASVTYARLYWAATSTTTAADTSVTLARGGVFSADITADDSWVVGNGADYYQATADVTTLVQQHGEGLYRLADVDSEELVDTDENVRFSAWSLVVFYTEPGSPPRNIALFDGFDSVSTGNDVSAALSGFTVPNAGFDAKLGVIAYEGDDAVNGDELRFGMAPLDASDRLSDAANPVGNFFNGTRASLGVFQSVAGDLPQLTGMPGSMSSFDIDVIDITDRLTGGQTSADFRASSTGDVYFLGGFVTSISTFAPSFTTSTKTVVDVNGGEVLIGDELDYLIHVENAGNDVAIDAILRDTLPTNVAFVPGTLVIAGGPNQGVLTDDAGDDQGEHVAGTVTVRLGSGADSTSGGMLGIAETTTISMRVTATAIGEASNQGTVTSAGQLGAPESTTPTDADDATPGQQPTVVMVHECSDHPRLPARQPHV